MSPSPGECDTGSHRPRDRAYRRFGRVVIVSPVSDVTGGHSSSLAVGAEHDRLAVVVNEHAAVETPGSRNGRRRRARRRRRTEVGSFRAWAWGSIRGRATVRIRTVDGGGDCRNLDGRGRRLFDPEQFVGASLRRSGASLVRVSTGARPEHARGSQGTGNVCSGALAKRRIRVRACRLSQVVPTHPACAPAPTPPMHSAHAVHRHAVAPPPTHVSVSWVRLRKCGSGVEMTHVPTRPERLTGTRWHACRAGSVPTFTARS